MIFFKPYDSIKNFLYRYTILKIGKLHIRLHKIVDKDGSTLYHTHPFHYISIILKGGYKERVLIGGGKEMIKTNRFLSIICRNKNVYHRIDEIYGETVTLFFAFGNYGWTAVNSVKDHDDDGLYEREIKGEKVWAKRECGIWYIGHKEKTNAIAETRPSIYQV